MFYASTVLSPVAVLIESDWNLKNNLVPVHTSSNTVLIESDWNLKLNLFLSSSTTSLSINRIRLEFKGKRQLCTYLQFGY